MLTKEELEKLITDTRNKLDEKSQALISEDLLGIMGNYNSALTTLSDRNTEVEKLKKDNEELLMVNGRLFQKIGFQKEEEIENTPFKKEETEKIGIENLINEKGEII